MKKAKSIEINHYECDKCFVEIGNCDNCARKLNLLKEFYCAENGYCDHFCSKKCAKEMLR